MSSDEECGGYDSCGNEGGYGSYDGDDGHCYDDSGKYGLYGDEAGYYDDHETHEDYEAREDEYDDSYASSQEVDDSNTSRFDVPTYSSCHEFENENSDLENVDEDCYSEFSCMSSSLYVAPYEQEGSRGPFVMGGGGGCSMGKRKLAYLTCAKGLNAPNSHLKVGLRNGVALATKGLHCSNNAVKGSSGRSDTMGYGTKARGTQGFHRDIPSSTFNNTSNVGRVTGSGSCPSNLARRGGIRETQVVGVDTLEHSSSSLDVLIRGLCKSRFIVEVNGFGGCLLRIGDTDSNYISTSLVDRLRIPCHALEHPYEYSGVRVSKEARVLISHGSYKGYVWCDVYPIPYFDVWLGEPWLHNKELQYEAKRDVYLVGMNRKVYEFAPYGLRGKMSARGYALIMQMRKERELHSMVKIGQSRSPTNTRNGGTSAIKELTSVNKVSPTSSGSPTKKKGTSSDDSQSPNSGLM